MRTDWSLMVARSGRMVLVTVVTVALAACTNQSNVTPASRVTEASDALGTTAAGQAAPITVPPVLVDIGVDAESSVVVVAVLAPSEAGLAGHRAYWSSVNLDLDGVGGRFDVELLEVGSVAEAFTADVAAVSLDEGPLEPVPGDMFAIAPSQTVDALSMGRTLDVTRPSFGAIVAAASQLAASEDFVVAGSLGVVAGPSCPFDPMTYQLTEGADAAFVLVCGTPDEARSAVAEIGGVVLLANEAWHPSLGADLPDATYVLGALPGPGGDAPASEVLAEVAGDGPWDPAFVRGYTAALTTHLALERAYADGDLTRAGINGEADGIEDADTGFGDAGSVSVAVL
ncbi:MAG: hypothetical protein OEM97_09985, partial [Acidimicrobiia bacterium]|nr:hypothetical protein [Acidimicrobiia bacterium]